MASRKRRRQAPVPLPPLAPARPAGWLDLLATEEVPDGVQFTGVLATRNATPMTSVLGVVVGIGSFLAFSPLLTELLAAFYWLAVGRPGTFAATYASLLAFQVPFGMAASQLGIALLIPVTMLLVLTIHHVRPAYVFSVRPGVRWRLLLVFLAVALVTLNGVLWIQNAIAGKSLTFQPQQGLAGFLVAIVLTSPLQAAAEEVFFRGYLLQALGSLAPNRWVGIVGSALVFALFHGTQNVWLFVSRFAFGVLMAVLVVFVGGLEAGIAAHVVNNVSAFVYAGLSTGIASLRATQDETPLDAAGEVVLYAVFAAAALAVVRLLRPRTRTGRSGLGDAARVR